VGYRPGAGQDLNGRQFDVVCVGCGPAGNLCAWRLARAGHRVLLIDRSDLPRNKTCGGGLSARALALLPFDIAPVVHRRMDGARLTLAGRTLADIDSPGIGAMIERAEFDQFMSRQAVAAGAELWPATELLGFQQQPDGLTVRTARGTVQARLLIGADGAHSRVRQLLFPDWQPDWAIGLEARFRWPPDAAPRNDPFDRASFDFGALDTGYGWIFPKRDHFNVGIYRLHKPDGAAGMKAQFDRFVLANPLLHDCRRETSQGHPIPLSNGRQPLAKGRALLVGDAAGLGEAFLGEGIAFALDSAGRAADWADRMLRQSGPPVVRDYLRALRPLTRELRYSLRIARLLYRLPAPLLERTAADPGVQRVVVGLLHGRRSYRASFWRLLWQVPLALWTAADVAPLQQPPAQAD